MNTADNGRRLSLKLPSDSLWLIDEIEKERKSQNRPSVNNTIIYILTQYFRKKEKNNASK